MTEYRVSYTIDVEADTPEEAARRVADLLEDGGAQRGSYEVIERNPALDNAIVFDGEPIEVDLELLTQLGGRPRLLVWKERDGDPNPWNWSLQGKDGVYGSVSSHEEAVGYGLHEWRETYPEDFA